MTVQPARLVNTEQESSTHSGVRVVTFYCRCHDAASSVYSKMSFSWRVISWISHIAVTTITSSTHGQQRKQCIGHFWNGGLHQLMWSWKESPRKRCFSENPPQLLTASASNTADLKRNTSVRLTYRMFRICLLFTNNSTFVINETYKACVALWPCDSFYLWKTKQHFSSHSDRQHLSEGGHCRATGCWSEWYQFLQTGDVCAT